MEETVKSLLSHHLMVTMDASAKIDGIAIVALWTAHDKMQRAKPINDMDNEPEAARQGMRSSSKRNHREKDIKRHNHVDATGKPESPHQQEYAQHRKKNGIQTKDPSTCLMVTHIIVYCLYVQVVMYIYFRAMICTSILLN
eukprot:354337_1